MREVEALLGRQPKQPGEPGGRNLQSIKRVSGDSVAGDADRDIYPGKIVWLPADDDEEEIADCWIDPASGQAPLVGEVCSGVQNGYHTDAVGETLPVFWGFNCGQGPGRTESSYTRCINGDLVTYVVGTDGVPRIADVQSGCCDNDSGTHSGGAYDDCTSPAFDLETGAPAVVDTGGTPVSVGDLACVHAQPSVCLTTATVGGGDPAAPADTCGDGSGQVWTGSNLMGSWALYKCGILWCMTTTPADPAVTPTTACTAISPTAGPCDAPPFSGVFFIDPETGAPYTATITPTASGTSCTWNCWQPLSPAPGDALSYCSTSDDSGTATLSSGPYTSEADCIAACHLWDCYRFSPLVPSGTPGTPGGCRTTVPPAAITVLGTTGPYTAEADCTTACAPHYYCLEWVLYSDDACTASLGLDPDTTGPGGTNPFCVTDQDDLVLGDCVPGIGDERWIKAQIVSGPHSLEADCTDVCV